ncbi:MAG: membrane protein insertion efficiency factor YidD [Thermodesulfovibrionales bacterium]|nr:membrane protein insertion efficiency factor YidD [Thermodesulfovibrionales bacterium]
MFRALLIGLLRLYKYAVSPLLPSSCRFTPSCAEYSMEAIKRYGLLKGCYLSFKRILKCHPFHPGGYDPVK